MRTFIILFLHGVFSLLVASLCYGQRTSSTELSLLLTGNTYGYFDLTPVGKEVAGGIVRRKTIVEQVQRRVGTDHLLVLDAGNALGYYYLLRGDRGKSMMSTMNAIGYDAMTVGSHEFDYGKEVLQAYSAAAEGPAIVCANVIQKTTNEPLLRPYIIKEKAGIRIAFLGLTDPEIEQATLRRHFEGLTVQDPLATAKTYIPQLRNESDIVIALTHLKFDDCYKMALAVPGIDVIISRADRSDDAPSVRKEYLEPETQTLIVSPLRFGTGISHVKVRFDRTTKKVTASLKEIIPVNASVAGDVEFATRLAVGGEQQYNDYCRTTYGVEPDEPLMLIDDSFTNADLVRFILHILLQQTETELALLNNTSFRFEGIELPRYEADPRYRKITIRLLEQILWTDNELVLMRLTGQQLSALQRMSTGNQSAGRDNYLQHLQITSQGNEEWYVHNAGIQQRTPAEFYRIATSNFLAGGGEGFTAFREGTDQSFRFAEIKTVRPIENGKPFIIRDFIIRYLIRQYGENHRTAATPFAVIDTSYRERMLWRFSLARLQLSYSAGQYRSNTEYRNIGLTELRGSDFDRITYETDLRLKQESSLLIWDNRLYAAFGQSKITGQPVQEVLDDLFFETVVNFRAWRTSNGFSVYPSASARYDTEITPTESKKTVSGVSVTLKNPRQQDVTIGVGIGFSEFAGFNRTRVSLTQTYDQSSHPRPDENGINLQTSYQLPLIGSMFRSELDGTYYIKQKKSTGDTRRILVRWKSDLAIPLGRFTLAPSLYVFLFQGQQSSQPGAAPPVATAVVMGVSLGYSFDWKMQYESLF